MLGALGVFLFPLLCALLAALLFRGDAGNQLIAALSGLGGGMLLASGVGRVLGRRPSFDEAEKE